MKRCQFGRRFARQEQVKGKRGAEDCARDLKRKGIQKKAVPRTGSKIYEARGKKKGGEGGQETVEHDGLILYSLHFSQVGNKGKEKRRGRMGKVCSLLLAQKNKQGEEGSERAFIVRLPPRTPSGRLVWPVEHWDEGKKKKRGRDARTVLRTSMRWRRADEETASEHLESVTHGRGRTEKGEGGGEPSLFVLEREKKEGKFAAAKSRDISCCFMTMKRKGKKVEGLEPVRFGTKKREREEKFRKIGIEQRRVDVLEHRKQKGEGKCLNQPPSQGENEGRVPKSDCRAIGFPDFIEGRGNSLYLSVQGAKTEIEHI